MSISPTTRMTIGLVLMTLSILIIADLLGLFVSKNDAIIESRTKLTENTAIQISYALGKNDLGMIRSVMNTIQDKNKEIKSLGLRLLSGSIFLKSGDHDKYWVKLTSDLSTATQMQVPVFKNRKKWAMLEVQFKEVEGYKLLGYSFNPVVVTFGFIGVSCFILFGMFLRRTLRHLDPSQVVPDRVRNALDVLAEGVLILDNKEQILLANAAFARKTEKSQQDIVGKKVYELDWEKEELNKKRKKYPWDMALETKEPVLGEYLYYTTPSFTTTTFMVNCAPIVDDDNNIKGFLATFDDVTQLENRNKQLQKMLKLLKESEINVKQKNKELQFLATKDPLTNCLNRRAFHEVFDAVLSDAIKSKGNLACLMLDIDFFKKINDTYGHKSGDMIICGVAKAIKNSLRKTDVVCRYGGEEFCVLLPNTSLKRAQDSAERIRKSIEEIIFKDDAGNLIRATSSIGVSEITQELTNPSEIIDSADKALYEAKETGRNKVVCWSGDLRTNPKEPVVQESLPSIQETEEQTFIQQGMYDTVTGLPVRTIFLDSIRHTIYEANANPINFALFIIDIDMFKRINNSLGHAAGDEVLMEISQRLKNCLRQEDELSAMGKSTLLNMPVARIGGDEFGVFVNGIDNDEQLKVVIDRVIDTIQQPYTINKCDFQMSCSIGVSIYPQDGESAEMLLKNAEVAMYHAKKKGRNAYCRYTKEIDNTSVELLQLEYEFLNALEQEQFVVYYQPKVDTKQCKVKGFEALLRWNHPRTGMVPPTQFIPLAEDTGKINELGNWVLRRACEDIKSWIDQGYNDIHVSVNMSILQFKQNDLYEQVITILSETGVQPHHLEFEVTESAIMENLQYVVTTLDRFHKLGIHIAIDDFGVGYSSLNYIKRFPVDTLKIDRSFVQNITTDADDRAIIAAIIAMAKIMGLEVIAEGVEEPEQSRMLIKLKCDQMQGYLYGEPMKKSEVTGFLEKNFVSFQEQSFPMFDSTLDIKEPRSYN